MRGSLRASRVQPRRAAEPAFPPTLPWLAPPPGPNVPGKLVSRRRRAPAKGLRCHPTALLPPEIYLLNLRVTGFRYRLLAARPPAPGTGRRWSPGTSGAQPPSRGGSAVGCQRLPSDRAPPASWSAPRRQLRRSGRWTGHRRRRAPSRGRATPTARAGRSAAARRRGGHCQAAWSRARAGVPHPSAARGRRGPAAGVAKLRPRPSPSERAQIVGWAWRSASPAPGF